jgi:hypothetical protein
MKNHNLQGYTTTVAFNPIALPAVLGVVLLLTVFALCISSKAEAAAATTAQLQAETNARIAADTTEKNVRINAVNTEKNVRASADTAETSARTNADTTLTIGLTAEQKARQQGDANEAVARQQAIQTAITGLQSQLNVLTALLPPAPPTGAVRPELTLRLCPGKDTPQWERCTYAIGDTGPAGGIVFYVTDGGLHGLEAAPVDLEPAPWGCYGSEIAGADNHTAGSGAQNTKDILAGCSEPGIAARVADGYSLNGYDDWYLPSIDDLYFMSNNIGIGASAPLTNIGNFATSGYKYNWSSSELDSNAAWLWQFISNGTNRALKSDLHFVRPVRSF